MPSRHPRTVHGRTVESPETGRRYRLRERLGVGGFGEVWRCESSRGDVCIKLTEDQESWHREAYMAHVVGRHANVVRIFETFPLVERGRVLYAVVMELMVRGTVEDVVGREGAWPERRVTPALRGLLDAVDVLHLGGGLHRDITPKNVFVGENGRIKLGDFGVATHGAQDGAFADAFAEWFVDTRLRKLKRRHWDARDDLWQVGQLASVLLTGKVEPIAPAAVRWLPCSESLKMVIARATGERWSSFRSAADMVAALSATTPWPFSRPKSLEGRNVVFTGALGIPRRRAVELAEKAGARVHRDYNAQTDTLVVGSSDQWAAGGAGGRKLIAAAAARERGAVVHFVREKQFLKLVGSR